MAIVKVEIDGEGGFATGLYLLWPTPKFNRSVQILVHEKLFAQSPLLLIGCSLEAVLSPFKVISPITIYHCVCQGSII